MEKANFFILMGIFLMGIGLKTRRMVMVFIIMSMGLSMRAIGKMICNMGLERKIGQMARNMKETIIMGRKKEKVYFKKFGGFYINEIYVIL